MANFWLPFLAALLPCFVRIALADSTGIAIGEECEYSSSALNPCVTSAIQGSCSDYYQIFATLQPQNITSPLYPNSHPDNIVCRWVISACKCSDPNNPGAEYRVQVEMLDFEMQDSPSCMKDFVEIKDGKRLWDHRFSQFCGNKCAVGESNITTSYNMQLLVTFQTDIFDPKDPTPHRGFLATYKCVSQPPKVGLVVFGPANYVLIAFSCFLAILFGSATVVLVMQEKHRSRYQVGWR